MTSGGAAFGLEDLNHRDVQKTEEIHDNPSGSHGQRLTPKFGGNVWTAYLFSNKSLRGDDDFYSNMRNRVELQGGITTICWFGSPFALQQVPSGIDTKHARRAGQPGAGESFACCGDHVFTGRESDQSGG